METLTSQVIFFVIVAAFLFNTQTVHSAKLVDGKLRPFQLTHTQAEFLRGKIPWNPNLGIVKKGHGRIVNGETAETGQFPYQVRILINSGEGGEFFCGGTIVSTEHILTAAHCVDEATYVEISFGSLKLDDEAVLRLNSSDITVHPKWNPERLIFDVAVIKLDTELTFDNETIAMIELASKPKQSRKNTVATASGWGITEDFGTLSNSLQYMSSHVIDNQKCKESYDIKDKSVLCVSGEDLKDACAGDSGGPLVCRDIKNDKDVLCGITSFGYISCSQGWPGAYCKVSEIVGWLEKLMDQNR